MHKGQEEDRTHRTWAGQDNNEYILAKQKQNWFWKPWKAGMVQNPKSWPAIGHNVLLRTNHLPGWWGWLSTCSARLVAALAGTFSCRPPSQSRRCTATWSTTKLRNWTGIITLILGFTGIITLISGLLGSYRWFWVNRDNSYDFGLPGIICTVPLILNCTGIIPLILG